MTRILWVAEPWTNPPIMKTLAKRLIRDEGTSCPQIWHSPCLTLGISLLSGGEQSLLHFELTYCVYSENT